MWIMTPDSFVSIVKKDCPPDCLLVRSRRRGDIERLFPDAEIIEGGGTDYQFRTAVPAKEVARVVAERIESIDYGNHKAATKDDGLHRAYVGVWREMARLGR